MSNVIHNKVVVNETTYIDLSLDTVASAAHIRQGYKGHLNDGTQVTGTYSGETPTLVTKSITANGTYNASSDNADGYSQVTVNVAGSAMNVQTAQSTTSRNNTALGSVVSLTCSKTGTYDVYWGCARTNTSSGYTWGSQLYIDGTAYGTKNTTWSSRGQSNHLTNVQISANQTVAVYGQSRSGYYIMIPQLTIVQTA